MAISKTRVGAPISAKPKKSDGDQFLLARGLSARYTGANTPLVGLTSEEMERDIRHMEAFSNACTAYSQQFYISQNSNDGVEDGKSTKALASPPIIAMPVRIDPEEEKRLTNLRQKIQQCEAQREIMESQYLSLRAHYVYLSKKLKAYRGTVSGHVKFLQEQVQKRGKLVALQRARLQIAREVLAALIHRQRLTISEADDSTDLVEVWNKIEEKFKKAEKDCRSSGLESWHAMKVPQVPPGVPLMLSQLAKQPALASAWSAGGMFGSNKDTMCWLEPLVPQNKDKSELVEELPKLRKKVQVLRENLYMEDDKSKSFQTEIISCRKKNDELVAMMALLRTETEAVVARHNIILQSEAAREAAGKQLSEEEVANGGNDEKDSVVGESAEDGNAGNEVPLASKSEDPESYGDDERGAEDEEEIGGSKRALDGENGSPRSKRRKL
ncbi:unnamed protein product [Cylindrotheca closterium]|uniref:Uncharacterized protein n=1 Tax=Cylindrotheca closterium TaxID=2856 RepID=A0AAD2FTZ0_9STRA|nr:unnamed protein product [Cylindrotheca closterium]